MMTSKVTCIYLQHIECCCERAKIQSSLLKKLFCRPSGVGGGDTKKQTLITSQCSTNTLVSVKACGMFLGTESNE